MKIEINSRGNGACPLCNLTGNCRVQDTLHKSISSLYDSGNTMELVVYSCPQFQEKQERE